MPAHWLTPDLSVESQFQKRLDIERLRVLSHTELLAQAETILAAWYDLNHVVNGALGPVRRLEVEVALAVSKPLGQPTEEHHQWAKELAEEAKLNSLLRSGFDWDLVG